MKKLVMTATCAVLLSSAAMAQSTSTNQGEQVNPGTNPSVGKDSTFGMNNMGDPNTGKGLRGGKTSDTHEWLRQKEEQNLRDAKERKSETR